MECCPAALGKKRTVRGFLLALLGSTRPMSSLVPGTLACAAVWIRNGISLRGILAGLAMYSLAAFGFQVNDILDFRKDKAAGVRRPVAAGDLTRRAALLFALALLLVTFAISARVGSGGKVLAATALALILYTPTARKLPLIKGIYVACLCITPLYYGSVINGASYAWPPYLLVAVFITGREAFMDSNEMEDDRNAGMVTIAVVLGETRTKAIATFAMALSMAVLAVAASRGIAKAAAIVAFVSLLFVFIWPRLDDNRRIELSRIPMLATAVALACG